MMVNVKENDGGFFLPVNVQQFKKISRNILLFLLFQVYINLINFLFHNMPMHHPNENCWN